MDDHSFAGADFENGAADFPERWSALRSEVLLQIGVAKSRGCSRLQSVRDLLPIRADILNRCAPNAAGNSAQAFNPPIVFAHAESDECVPGDSRADVENDYSGSILSRAWPGGCLGSAFFDSIDGDLQD